MKAKIFKETKKFWESKTFWVNALALIAGISTALAGEIQAGSTISALSVANIILRVVTNKGIKFE